MGLLDDFSMEMTGKDVARLEAAAVKRLGFTPVPHISARRIRSKEMLEEFLGALQAIGATANVFAVGVLWSALESKSAALARLGVPGAVLTQVEFDVDRILGWLADVRRRGVELPVRVGVPGPTSIKGLLGFASRLGVSTSTTIARKYGFSVTNLLGKAGPDTFIRDLEAGLDPAGHGQVGLHFYTFGGFKSTAEWISEFRGDI